MPISITNEGILTQTLGEVTAELDASFRVAFPPVAGEQLDTTADSYTGREILILGEQFVTAQDLLLEFVALLDPQQAQGAAIDYQLSLQATARLPATSSTIAALVYGVPGTAVGDKRVRYLPTSSLWRTPAGLAIGPTGQTVTTLTAVDTGPVSALETGTEQWLIVDVTTDWTAVESTADSVPGTNAESDAAARVRLRHSAAGLCSGTLPAITRALWAVPGVSSVDVWNNRTLLPNAQGVPAKSIESVLEGGADPDVALAVFRAYNGTAGYAGTTSYTVTDTITLEDGSTVDVTETVRWSRIERIDIVSEVTITVLDSALLGADAEAVVQGAVADWMNALPADIDVYPEAVNAQVWAALPDGSVSDVVSLIAVKPGAPAGVPLSLSIRQRARANAAPQQAAVVGSQVQTFNLTAGWILDLSFDGAAVQTVAIAVQDYQVISAATALEIATAIQRQITQGIAGVDEGAVTLTSQTAGGGSSIQVMNTSTGGLLAVLGLSVGTTLGSDGDVTVVWV